MYSIYELDKNRRYLIAVSGGPDSMALLDMCTKAGLYIEVAHVNYHKRDSADRDELIVKNYCDSYDIVFHRLDYIDRHEGNFQAEARKARYSFFSELCLIRNLDYVLIAHQLDDLLETYLMQKEKKLGVAYYGLKPSNVIYGARVLRPLLDYEKKQLVEYCEANNIPYGIDESNLSDDYERNRIRHHVVDGLSYEEKVKLSDEAEKMNKENEDSFNRAYQKFYDKRISAEELDECKDLKPFFWHYFPHKSAAHLQEMIRQLHDAEQCLFKGEDLYIVKEYNYIDIFPVRKGYEYVIDDLDKINEINNPYFKLSDKGSSFDGASVGKRDFPLTIRNARTDDSIMMKFGHKKLNRFFIDRKIAYKDRLIWPVLVNSSGDVILVPELGCDIDHYSKNHNIFVIKL